MIAKIIFNDGSQFNASISDFNYDVTDGHDYLVLYCKDGQMKAFKVDDFDTFALTKE